MNLSKYNNFIANFDFVEEYLKEQLNIEIINKDSISILIIFNTIFMFLKFNKKEKHHLNNNKSLYYCTITTNIFRPFFFSFRYF